MIDNVLRTFIQQFEVAFPQRIYGVYLEGSYADSTALTTSDIDLIIVFNGEFHCNERTQAEQFVEAYNTIIPYDLDVGVLAAAEIMTCVPPSLKLGSTLLHGKLIPDAWPLVAVEDWGRERMYAAYWLMTKVFGRPASVVYPLEYPQSTAPFYGYTNRNIRLPHGDEVPSTRNLIRVMGWAATALVAFIGSQIVVRKKNCHELYRVYVSDKWATLLEDIYHKCRQDWHYQIPQTPGEQGELRSICQRALGFENHFLIVYKQFLLHELQSADPSIRIQAIEMQKQIPYLDPKVIELLYGFTRPTFHKRGTSIDDAK
ncbi:MAG: nucleotidyltransferase domain-containing protein [Chloroflexota bacterium]